MYIYDDFDRTLVNERVAEFRDQVAAEREELEDCAGRQERAVRRKVSRL